MKTIDRPARDLPQAEFFDNRTQEFVTIEAKHLPAVHLQLEHSLRSIAKWESRWHEPFIGRDDLSGEMLLDYIRCMTINTVKDPAVYDALTQEDLLEILEYMQDANSAWQIREEKKKTKKGRKKPDTVEAIYFAMIQYGIPPEYENWHFNRLIALIDYFDSKGGGEGGGSPRKKSEREIMEMYRALNEKNRKKYNSKG